MNFLLVNVHLYWNPEFNDVKLWQTMELLSKIENDFGKAYPIILLGDFNSEPSSSVYEYITKQKVDKSEVTDDRDIIDYDMTHSINLFSVYSTLLGYEPYTIANKFKSTLDYIFLSEHFRPARIRNLPKNTEEIKYDMPNGIEPSDHYMLVCDVALYE